MTWRVDSVVKLFVCFNDISVVDSSVSFKTVRDVATLVGSVNLSVAISSWKREHSYSREKHKVGFHFTVNFSVGNPATSTEAGPARPDPPALTGSRLEDDVWLYPRKN